jgi:exonuclease III
LNVTKKADLLQYVHKYKPTIIALTETWLTDKTENNASINNYNLYTAHRCNSRIGGGASIHIDSKINAAKVDSLVTRTASAVWVKLANPSHVPLIVGCLYHPKSKCAEDSATTVDYIISSLSKLTSRYKRAKIILCGDFNHLDLSTVCESFKLHKLVNFSTRQGSILDNIYSDILQYTKSEPAKIAPLIGNEADHCCIFIPPSYRKKHTYEYKTIRTRTSDSKYTLTKELVCANWQDIYNEPDVNRKAVIFQQNMRAIADKVCPLKRIRVRDDHPPWENQLTQKIRRARDRAYKKSAPSYKYLSGVLKGIIAKNRKAWVARTITSLSNGDKRWWQRAKSLSGQTKISADYTMIDEKWYNNKELADLNIHFTTVGGKPENTDNLMHSCNQGSNHVIEVHHGQVKSVLLNLKANKSVSSEDFPPWISKEFGDILCKPLTDIINTMFKQNVFPDIWKRAEVVPLPKVNNPSQCKDYRPISLLFHCGKVAEKFFMAEYKRQILPKISDQQFAYKP